VAKKQSRPVLPGAASSPSLVSEASARSSSKEEDVAARVEESVV